MRRAAQLSVGMGFVLALWSAIGWSAPDKFSLDELKRLALASNRSLTAALSGVDASRAGVLTASAYPNPETEFGFGHAAPRLAGGAAGASHTYTLTQRIDNPWQREARIAAAQSAVSSAESGLRVSQNTVLARLATAFYDLLRRQEEVVAAREDLALAESIGDKVRVRVEVGEAPRYELIKAEAERLSAQTAARSAELRVEQAKVAIRSLVSAELPAQFEVVGDWSELVALPPVESLRQRLLDRSSELAVLRADVARAQRLVELEKARRMPEVAVRAVQERDPDLENNRVGVVLTIPLWDRRAGPVAEAEAQVTRGRSQLEHSQFVLAQSIESAWGQYGIARNLVASLENGILREAEAALKVAEAAYRFGERGILDFLDARRVFRAARNDLIAARFELEAARIEVERLQGDLLRSDAP